jgi:hypothetical protein
VKRLAVLISMVLACSRTSLGLRAPDGGSAALGGSGGSVVVPPDSGGAPGNGGAGGRGIPIGTDGSVNVAGAGGVGGAPATGGVGGSGGASSTPDGSVPDADLHDVVLAGCTPLPVEWLEEPTPYACHPISNSACYPAIDVGAMVARYNACLVSWGATPLQCAGWSSLADGQEFVVLTVEDCGYDVTIESLEACADSIQVKYLLQGTCSSCDGKRSNFRVLVLPRDARPVVAVSQGTVMPPCPPPP